MAFSATYNLFFLSLFILLILAMGNIPLDSSLTANEDYYSWLSPSGDLAFGFHQLNNIKSPFLLAVWFNKIPDKTIVWHPNGSDAVQEGSKVELTSSGLVLYGPGGELIWKAETNETVSYGAMLDTGNFVLPNTDSVHIWEIFRNPTDTILPTQILELGVRMFSRLNDENYSKGGFELHFLNGDLELCPIAWPTQSLCDAYYSSRTSNPNDPSESGYQVVFNESADIYVLKRNGGIVQLNWQETDLSSDYYHRATLDFYGVFTQYTHPKTSPTDQTWSIVRYVPSDICTSIFNDLGRGACGFNSYCTSVNGRPNCECPNGFILLDPNDQFGGCRPNFTYGCGIDDGLGKPEDLYELWEHTNLNWPLGDYERLNPFNHSECENSCLNDCFCVVAVHDGTTCWKKGLPIANGRTANDYGGIVMVKVRREGVPSSVPPVADTTTKDHDKMIFTRLLGFSLIIITISLLVIMSLVSSLKRVSISRKIVLVSGFFETNLHIFSYRDLEEATNGFKEQLGRGSFGTVYKGVLNFGSKKVVVAVKKLDKLVQERQKEFETELSVIGRTHHKNLVRMLGFCEEGAHRPLVYEFMSKGTLVDFLFGISRPDWNQRANIALGIACVLTQRV